MDCVSFLLTTLFSSSQTLILLQTWQTESQKAFHPIKFICFIGRSACSCIRILMKYSVLILVDIAGKLQPYMGSSDIMLVSPELQAYTIVAQVGSSFLLLFNYCFELQREKRIFQCCTLSNFVMFINKMFHSVMRVSQSAKNTSQISFYSFEFFVCCAVVLSYRHVCFSSFCHSKILRLCSQNENKTYFTFFLCNSCFT